MGFKEDTEQILDFFESKNLQEIFEDNFIHIEKVNEQIEDLKRVILGLRQRQKILINTHYGKVIKLTETIKKQEKEIELLKRLKNI